MERKLTDEVKFKVISILKRRADNVYYNVKSVNFCDIEDGLSEMYVTVSKQSSGVRNYISKFISRSGFIITPSTFYNEERTVIKNIAHSIYHNPKVFLKKEFLNLRNFVNEPEQVLKAFLEVAKEGLDIKFEQNKNDKNMTQKLNKLAISIVKSFNEEFEKTKEGKLAKLNRLKFQQNNAKQRGNE